MHISAEDIIVEIVDKEGKALPQGEVGEVCVTHLATSDFPFIRYRTGDIAVLDDGTCICGRSLPVLKEIRGRTTDFIVAEDGTVMHALALIYVIRDIPGVKNFQIVQEDLRNIRVFLVTSKDFTSMGEEQIRKGITRRVGRGVEVSTERRQQIPTEASGKHRYVVSRIFPEVP
jgi:phenylacetate-CoA ligase